MTPEQKAKELFYKFNTITSKEFKSDTITSATAAKQCAIIAVEEILKNFDGLHKPEYCAFDAIGERKFTFDGEYDNQMTGYDMQAYWNEVLTHLK